jgi:hypothetical protein
MTPAIDFDFESHRLRMAGESFPENVHTFYAPVFEELDRYLRGLEGNVPISVELHFSYVNSASMRSLQQLLTLLDTSASCGARVHVKWLAAADDDVLQELGEDLLHDKRWLTYEIATN